MSASGMPSLPLSDPHAAKEALLHFASAFVFLLFGTGALVWNSARLSAGDFADPRVLGGLHWITLGWLSLSIFGALRVFTGVALGSQGQGKRMAIWIRRLWTAGAAIFPVGLIFAAADLIIPGAMLLGVAILLYSIHILPPLFSAARGGLTRWYLVIALVSLWGTWGLGLSAAFLRAGSPLWTLPAGYFPAHILLAVFGWVGATVVGVGSHLLPMFALSRDPSSIPVRAALPFWAAIPILAAVGAFHPELLKFGWAAAGCGSGLWMIQVAIYFRSRLRRERDPGLFLAAGATLLLGLGWIALLNGAPTAFVGLLVIGWLTLFTLGIYHRVVPFLVWFARFARNAGRGPVPRVKDLIDERIAMTTAGLALVGAAAWGLGLFAHNGSAAYAGSLLIFLGSALALAQLRNLTAEARRKTPSATTLEAIVKGGASS